ncbi:hypothetical protein [Microbacterium sp. NPDC079176]|uniref:hypothetical protein n=1 Tax=Microbacterium sp. NPDC079176 TaxID=3154768 RepID=UPI0034321ACF
MASCSTYSRVSADVADMYIGTGARTNEVLALQFDANVHFDTPTPFVRLDRTLIEGDDGKLVVQMKPKTDSSVRDAKLPAFLVDMLMRRRVDSDSGIVFPSSTGTYQWDNNLMRQWREALRESPYAWVTPTKFRKAVATLLADEVGTKAAADQLGNSEEVAEKHYIKRARRQGPDAARDVLETFFHRG